MDSALRQHFLACLEQALLSAEARLPANWIIGPKAWLLFRANWRRPRLRPVRVEQFGDLWLTAENDGLPILMAGGR